MKMKGLDSPIDDFFLGFQAAQYREKGSKNNQPAKLTFGNGYSTPIDMMYTFIPNGDEAAFVTNKMAMFTNLAQCDSVRNCYHSNVIMATSSEKFQGDTRPEGGGYWHQITNASSTNPDIKVASHLDDIFLDEQIQLIVQLMFGCKTPRHLWPAYVQEFAYRP